MKRIKFLVIFAIGIAVLSSAHSFILRAFVPIANQQNYLQQMDDSYTGFMLTKFNWSSVVDWAYFIVLVVWLVFGCKKIIKLTKENEK